MTIIRLHGILAKEFGEEMYCNIRRPKEVFAAIDANKPNFIKRITELLQEGIHYSIVIDGMDVKEITELSVLKQFNKIDIVPAIVGTGPLVALIGAAVMIAGATSALAVGIGAVILGIGLQMTLAPKPKSSERAEATISARNESFAFSSKANLTQQGSPVPVGYGRLRIGSSVIQTTVKSFPQKYLQDTAMIESQLSSTTQAATISNYTDNK